MSSLECSIVITGYKDPEGLLRLLASCETLNYPRDKFEIIVVAGGLTEKSRQIIDYIEYNFAIKIFYLTDYGVRANARNSGLREAAGEKVLFLDSDLEVTPDLLMHHLLAYGDHAVGIMGDSLLPSFYRKRRWFTYLDNERLGARRLERNGETPHPKLPYTFIRHGNFSVKREDALEIGGFDESQELDGFEELEFAYRLEKAGRGYFKFNQDALTLKHYRPLKETMKSMFGYGQKVVPYIEKKHPDTGRDLIGFYVRVPDNTTDSQGKVARLCTTIAARKPFWWLARAGRLVLPQRFSYKMIQFMLFYQAVSGYRSSLKVE